MRTAGDAETPTYTGVAMDAILTATARLTAALRARESARPGAIFRDP